MPDDLTPQPAIDAPSQETAVPANVSADRVNPPLQRRELMRALLAFVGIAIFLPVLFFLGLHRWLNPNIKELSLRAVFPVEWMNACMVVLGTWAASRQLRRPLAALGLPPRQVFGARFWEGALWGFAMLSGAVFLLHALGDFQFGAPALSGAAAWKYALAWALCFLALGVYEETFFRGFFLFVLAHRMGFWFAALLLSAAFAVAHLGNSGENIFGILQVFVIGMFFCLTIRRTGSLWFAIGLHAAWDWAQTFFYGTPDSGLLGVGHYLNSSTSGPRLLTGGSAGPEGSVLAFAIVLLAAGLIHLRFPDAKYPDRPA
ncbi:MAG: lysostaphin resistance A-like protein [Candidatus Acidiferrales bacterium]